MSLTIDDHTAAGCKHATASLDMLAKVHGRGNAKAHCGGFMTGARNWLVSEYGRRDAYNLLQALADDVIEP